MKIYTLTEEFSLGGKVTLDSYKSEEKAIKAMKSLHESNMNLLPWSLFRDENKLYIEETDNSIYAFNEADSKFYYLLKVERRILHD
jgi:hypothetical protein